MTITELENTRNFVCAALAADPFTEDSVQIVDALIQIPIRDGFLRYLFDHPDLRAIAAKNLNNYLTGALIMNVRPLQQYLRVAIG